MSEPELLRTKQGAESTPRPDVQFPPVQNGMDYLLSVVGHLDRENPGPGELKYAVLHLQAATEVLLKACLLGFDWRLVFSRVDGADEVLLKKGAFKSCGIEDAIKRLREQGVDIPPAAKAEITALGEQRNRLQHYGLTDTAAAVEARAVRVLDFLVGFVDEYLGPGLDEGQDAQHLDNVMGKVKASLTRISSFVATRMDRLAAQLAPVKHTTIQCPDCHQWALVCDGEYHNCLFCPREWSIEELPLAYTVEIFGRSLRDFRKTGFYVETCPTCEQDALLAGVSVADDPELAGDFCFACSEWFSGLEQCLRCGQPFHPVEEEAICGECFSDMANRD